MPLLVRTARITYDGPDRLDITWKSSTGMGRAFAPSWGILEPALRARRQAERQAAKGERKQAEQLIEESWQRYVVSYRAQMHESYRCRREDWERLLRQHTVVLVCYCTDTVHCHRTLLAGYLGKLGATVAGELITERKGHDQERRRDDARGHRRGHLRTPPGGAAGGGSPGC